MTSIDEFNQLLAQATDANKSAEALSALQAKIVEMHGEYTALAEKSMADQNTIAELRDSNIKLFLKQTSTEQPEEEKEETLEQLNQRVYESFRNGE